MMAKKINFGKKTMGQRIGKIMGRKSKIKRGLTLKGFGKAFNVKNHGS